MQKKLKGQKLQEEGFNSSQGIVDWLEEGLGIKAAYKPVHKLVYYRIILFFQPFHSP